MRFVKIEYYCVWCADNDFLKSSIIRCCTREGIGRIWKVHTRFTKQFDIKQEVYFAVLTGMPLSLLLKGEYQLHGDF